MHLTASLLLSFAGWAGLALAMQRHRKAAHGGKPATPALRSVYRLAGAALLALAMIPCIDAWGVSTGITLWAGLLSLSALLVVPVLTYRADITRIAAVLAAIAGIAILSI